MKKTVILAVAFTFVVSLTAPAFALDLGKHVKKFTNGTMEIVKSPLVIYDHTKSEIDAADYKVIGFVSGLVTSPFHLIHKAGMGALDVATFPIE